MSVLIHIRIASMWKQSRDRLYKWNVDKFQGNYITRLVFTLQSAIRVKSMGMIPSEYFEFPQAGYRLIDMH